MSSSKTFWRNDNSNNKKKRSIAYFLNYARENLCPLEIISRFVLFLIMLLERWKRWWTSVGCEDECPFVDMSYVVRL